MIKKIVTIFFMIMITILCVGQLSIVKADEKNNDPMLKDIKINGEEINPSFEMFTTEYIVQVPEETTSIQIEAIPDDENASVEIIGDTDNLTIGRNQIEIKVTAENGIATQSYYIFVTRGNEEESNANLSSLTVKDVELAPNFDRNVINYAIEYPQELEKLEIEAIPEDDDATVSIIGNEHLTEISQTIEIKVTAKDGQTIKTYYIIAKKAGMEVENPEGKETNVENLVAGETNQESETKKETSENIPLKIMSIFIIIIVIIAFVLIIKFFMKAKQKDKK